MENSKKESVTLLVLSTIVLMLAESVGAIPFVLSLVYYIKTERKGEGTDSEQLKRIKIWTIVTLILSVIICIVVTCILGKAAFKALH